MGIHVESQTVIQCDFCLDTLIEVLRREDCIKLARKYKWRIGKVIVCPKCRAEGRKADYQP